MKQGRLIVHTGSYNATMGNEARKTHCLHKELLQQELGHRAGQNSTLGTRSRPRGIKG
ncbi:hypothetical protein KSS87_015145 [Heliosperma pusillum]|nr:hypothetical protein KSS87_015145 [Heliosperma pusillum]